MGNGFRIGLVQQACSDDWAVSIQNAIVGIREAHQKGAQVICLPELFASSYFCTREDSDLFELAEAINGKTVSAISEVAKELSVVVVVPFFERRAAGVYHNSAAVVDADGEVLGTYRKMHIPDDPLYYEKFYFTPGDADDVHGGYKVFATKYGVIGVLICWDQWYPEAARITSLLGASVLFYPTAIGWHLKEKALVGKDQHAAWQTVQRGHAIANGIYVAAVNRVGFEQTAGTDGLEFWGRSFIADPFGVLVEVADDTPKVVVADVDLGRIEEIRRNWPFYRDRRIESYLPLTKRVID